MNLNKVCSLLMATALVSAMSMSAFAAPPPTVTGTSNISTAGSTAAVPVELTAQTAKFSVTVPTSLPITVDAQGKVTCASNAVIKNLSHGPVMVKGLAVAGAEGWTVVDNDTNMLKEKVNTNKLGMTINNEATNGDNAISFDQSNWPSIPGCAPGTAETSAQTQPVNYDGKLPAHSKTISGATIANVTFTIGWDDVAGI